MSRNIERAQFLPYSYVRRNRCPDAEIWYGVTSNAEHPFCLFSPFFPHGGIPIPGLSGQISETVEGIWQGLKVIKGQTAPRYFRGSGKKRGGKPTGHQFGAERRLLKLEHARRRIYIPAYEWMLENRIPSEVLEAIETNMFGGIQQSFYDYESNGNISKDMPLAHAAVLVRWLNRRFCSQ